MTKREEFHLWKRLEWTIGRYLLIKSPGRQTSGGEWATRHIEIATIIWEHLFVKSYHGEFHKEMMLIHDITGDDCLNSLSELNLLPNYEDSKSADICAHALFEHLLLKLPKCRKAILDFRKSREKH